MLYWKFFSLKNNLVKFDPIITGSPCIYIYILNLTSNLLCSCGREDREGGFLDGHSVPLLLGDVNLCHHPCRGRRPGRLLFHAVGADHPGGHILGAEHARTQVQ